MRGAARTECPAGDGTAIACQIPRSVAYQIKRPGATETYGWLLVQMLAADRIRVQFFLGATARPAAFTSAAQEYLR